MENEERDQLLLVAPPTRSWIRQRIVRGTLSQWKICSKAKLLAKVTCLKTRCRSCAEPKWRQLHSFYSALCKQGRGVCLGGVGPNDPEKLQASFPPLATMEGRDAKGKRGSRQGGEQSRERLEGTAGLGTEKEEVVERNPTPGLHQTSSRDRPRWSNTADGISQLHQTIHTTATRAGRATRGRSVDFPSSPRSLNASQTLVRNPRRALIRLQSPWLVLESLSLPRVWAHFHR